MLFSPMKVLAYPVNSDMMISVTSETSVLFEPVEGCEMRLAQAEKSYKKVAEIFLWLRHHPSLTCNRNFFLQTSTSNSNFRLQSKP